jgi:hypothetical protein
MCGSSAWDPVLLVRVTGVKLEVWLAGLGCDVLGQFGYLIEGSPIPFRL